MRQHTECEGTVIKCEKGEHDLAWGNPVNSYFKLKPEVKTKIVELVQIQDGCSTRSGIVSEDGKLYCVNYPYNLRLEKGEKVLLTATKHFPSVTWNLTRN